MLSWPKDFADFRREEELLRHYAVATNVRSRLSRAILYKNVFSRNARRRDFLNQKTSFAANCRSLGAAALTTYPNLLLSVIFPLIAWGP